MNGVPLRKALAFLHQIDVMLPVVSGVPTVNQTGMAGHHTLASRALGGDYFDLVRIQPRTDHFARPFRYGYRLRATVTRQVLLTRAGFST